jgi:UDP-glucose 4-epimerase
MKVLVVGGAGYIGSHMVKMLLDARVARMMLYSHSAVRSGATEIP